LLYLLGALDEPTTGRIDVDGRNLADWSPRARDAFRRREVGFIFQSFNLLDNLSALDNVLVPDLPGGVTAQRRTVAVQLLHRVGLESRLEHRPRQLSGGEQQRVAIARALLKRPRLVLADEPTGELDTETGRQVFQQLRELQQEQGTTVVTVTHDQRYIEPGDLVLTIRDGRIV
jgi:putative ABC transport system ATP-binding protein